MDKLVGTELATFNLSQLTEDMLLRSDEPYEYLWSVSYTHLDVYKRQAYSCWR